jgi:hypothetical protein
MNVFLLWHAYTFDVGGEDEKLIGVYSTRDEAEAAIGRVKGQPGFVDAPEGFLIDPYVVNEDHWAEGYVTVPGDE